MSDALRADDSTDVLRQIRLTRTLAGRYYLEKWFRFEDQKNFLPICETKVITPSLVRFTTPFPAVLNDRAFVYVENLGLLRGVISRAMGPTSEMEIGVTDNERSRLASRILWLDMQMGFKGTDLRRFPRYEPANPDSSITLADGSTIDCTIANLSPTGAAIVSTLRPPLQSAIILGQIHSEIVRHTDVGFAVQFSTIQDPGTLDGLVARAQPDPNREVLILRERDESDPA